MSNFLLIIESGWVWSRILMVCGRCRFSLTCQYYTMSFQERIAAPKVLLHGRYQTYTCIITRGCFKPIYILLIKFPPLVEWEISREREATEKESYQHLPAGRNSEHCSSFYPKVPEAQEPKEPGQYYSNQFTLLATLLSLYILQKLILEKNLAPVTNIKTTSCRI